MKKLYWIQEIKYNETKYRCSKCGVKVKNPVKICPGCGKEIIKVHRVFMEAEDVSTSNK